MILGIGTDIIEVERIQTALQRFGDSFLQRILRPEEISYCHGFKNPAPHIAVRFAAKEAIAKAFGTGMGAQLGWLDLQVCRKASGEPFIVLHGAGQTLFAARRATQLLITLSHTHNYATAVAILEG